MYKYPGKLKICFLLDQMSVKNDRSLFDTTNEISVRKLIQGLLKILENYHNTAN